MNNKYHIYLVLFFLLLTSYFSSGCGKYMTQYSAPSIISKYPANGADGIGSAETIWVVFSKSMDTTGLDLSGLGDKMIMASDMTATASIFADATPEAIWSDDDTKLSIRNVFFIANPGNKVHYTASREAFSDLTGKFITEGSTLWNYTLSGLNIVSRNPIIGSTEANVTREVSVTFNNSVVTYEVDFGPTHTAGIPGSFTIYWTNNNKTMTSEVYWPTNPSVVDVTYEAVDIYGNRVNNGQLFKYNLQ